MIRVMLQVMMCGRLEICSRMLYRLLFLCRKSTLVQIISQAVLSLSAMMSIRTAILILLHNECFYHF